MVFPKNISQTVFLDSLPEIIETAIHNLSLQMPKQEWSQAVAEEEEGPASQASGRGGGGACKQAKVNLCLDQ